MNVKSPPTHERKISLNLKQKSDNNKYRWYHKYLIASELIYCIIDNINIEIYNETYQYFKFISSL